MLIGHLNDGKERTQKEMEPSEILRVTEWLKGARKVQKVSWTDSKVGGEAYFPTLLSIGSISTNHWKIFSPDTV